jgi:GNAT superfamily N-acetyltransferase
MKIRFAVPEDRQALIDIGLENQAEIVSGPISVNAQRVDEALHMLFNLNRGSHVLFVAETADGALAGALLGCVERYYYSDELQAQLIQWFLRPAYRGTSIAVRLVKAFVEWAKLRGASEVFIGISSGINLQQTDGLMRKLGFTYLGGNYSVSIKAESSKDVGTNSHGQING